MKLQDIQEVKSVESDIVEWVRRQVNELELGQAKYKQIPNRADEAINILTKLFRQDPIADKNIHPHWNVSKGSKNWRVVVRVNDYYDPNTRTDHLTVRRMYPEDIEDIQEAKYHRRDYTNQKVYWMYKKYERRLEGKETQTRPAIRAAYGGGFIQPSDEGYESVDAARLVFDFPGASSREQNMQYVKDFVRDNKLPYTSIRFSFSGYNSVLVDFVEDQQ